jgi:MFS family permease
MNRNVWLLFVAQSLNQSSTIAFVSMSALIGYHLADDKALATIPYALQMLATMCASIPAGILFTKLGRKPGFLVGAGATLLGTVICLFGVMREDFALFCAGSLCCGLGFGIGQHYRFAAAEVAGAAHRARAISLVMAGGVLAALFGPELVKRTKDAYGPLLFTATYVCLALLPLIGGALIAVTKLPPASPPVASPTPLRVIMARPGFFVAVVAGMVAYGSMNLVMTSTPLEMRLCGFGVDDSTDVIRMHALFMFAPGFVTGRLIQRFGVHRIILLGGVLTIACAAISVAGSDKIDFYAGLMALGLGWNFMFVGATSLLTTAYDSAERMRAQAANDLIVFGTVAATAFSSGALHAAQGWIALNMLVVVPVLAAMALVAWHRARVPERARC